MPSETALAFANTHQSKFLQHLKELIAIPSISTDPDHKTDMQHAAEWLQKRLLDIGMTRSEIYQTPGHPIVYSECLAAGPQKPTVLIYGHYDVQPPDPLDLWSTPPFSPTIEQDYLIARGASDMKGQILVSMSAVESVLAQKEFPLNIKWILEGEEEIGSIHLPEFIQEHRDLLACDVILHPDAGMIAPDVPTIVYALRGLAYFELRVYGPDHDLHSGMFGGVIHNPAIVLAEQIARLHDEQGRIAIPGFYDRVRELSAEERQALALLPMDEAYYLRQTGAPALYGEAGYSPAEQVGGRPSLDVNGLYAGFIGQGSKTIIPAYAMAKISMRTVPDQDPQEIHQLFRTHLQHTMPPTVRWELTMLGGGAASISDLHHPAVTAFAKAMRTVWGKDPVFKREGGSIPITGDFQRILGAESVLTGFGLPGDNIHSPNEHLHLPTWSKGIQAIIHFLYEYAIG